MQEIKERAKELLASGQVQRVLGWKRGEDLPYNPQPAFLRTKHSWRSWFMTASVRQT